MEVALEAACFLEHFLPATEFGEQTRSRHSCEQVGRPLQHPGGCQPLQFLIGGQCVRRAAQLPLVACEPVERARLDVWRVLAVGEVAEIQDGARVIFFALFVVLAPREHLRVWFLRHSDRWSVEQPLSGVGADRLGLEYHDERLAPELLRRGPRRGVQFSGGHRGQMKQLVVEFGQLLPDLRGDQVRRPA